MNWKKTWCQKLVVSLLTLVLAVTFITLPSGLFKTNDNVALAAPSAPSEAEVIRAPDVDLQMHLWLDEGQPYYSVVYKGEEIVEASRMGLDTSLGSLSANFTSLEMISQDVGDDAWSPLVGEKAVIQNKYTEKVFQLKQNGNLSLSIEMRAYNTGVAFRYLLPDASVHGNYNITDEQTRFALAPNGIALCHETGQQQLATKRDITNLPSNRNIYPPVTAVFDSGTALTLALAKLENYAYSLLNVNTEGRLKPVKETVRVTSEGPEASPYWTFVIGDTLADLPVNKDIILNLNDEPNEERYKFSEWVKPGKALMMGMFHETTETMQLQIDTAKKCGLEYLLMDFGWYGPEFAKKSDPRLNPEKLVADPNDSSELAAAKTFMRQYVTEDGVFNATGKPFNVYESSPWGGNIQMAPNLNIPEIIKYANSQGVGIFLYVNDVQLNDQLKRYEVDELFEQFASWGVSGVKPGFVPNKSQAAEKSTRSLVETAAKHKLMLSIHDEWIQTGIERQFPNLLTVEGVLGDEGLSTNQIEGDLNALFARGIQGLADHTICYPGKASRGFQLASSVLWSTGLNCVYWPWRNTDTQNRTTIESLPAREREFWREMPATWDDLVILKAEVSRSAATARRTGDIWYMGAISTVSQDMSLSLDFLDDDTQYVAEIYYDREGNNGNNSNRDNKTSNAQILYASYKVDSDTVLARQMEFGTGLAVRIRPIEQGDENLPSYNTYSRLGSLVRVLNELDSDICTPSSWTQLESALASAKSLMGTGELPSHEALSHEVLTTAYTALKNAHEGLEIKTEFVSDKIEIEAVSFVDGNGVSLTSLGSDTVKAELTLKNGYAKARPAVMYVAIYAPDGRLVHLGREEKILPVLTSESFQVTVDMPKNAQGQYGQGGYDIKAFLWDSVTGEPFTKSLQPSF